MKIFFKNITILVIFSLLFICVFAFVIEQADLIANVWPAQELELELIDKEGKLEELNSANNAIGGAIDLLKSSTTELILEKNLIIDQLQAAITVVESISLEEKDALILSLTSALELLKLETTALLQEKNSLIHELETTRDYLIGVLQLDSRSTFIISFKKGNVSIDMERYVPLRLENLLEEFELRLNMRSAPAHYREYLSNYKFYADEQKETEVSLDTVLSANRLIYYDFDVLTFSGGIKLYNVIWNNHTWQIPILPNKILNSHMRLNGYGVSMKDAPMYINGEYYTTSNFSISKIVVLDSIGQEYRSYSNPYNKIIRLEDYAVQEILIYAN